MEKRTKTEYAVIRWYNDCEVRMCQLFFYRSVSAKKQKDRIPQ